jgi:hypothetical protein
MLLSYLERRKYKRSKKLLIDRLTRDILEISGELDGKSPEDVKLSIYQLTTMSRLRDDLLNE